MNHSVKERIVEDPELVVYKLNSGFRIEVVYIEDQGWWPTLWYGNEIIETFDPDTRKTDREAALLAMNWLAKNRTAQTN